MNIIVVLMVLPLLVVLTNMLTNVIKGLSDTLGAHAKLIATLAAEALTMMTTIAYVQAYNIASVWYWYAGEAVAGMVVAYVAMNGYDGLYEDLIKHLKGLADAKVVSHGGDGE